MKNAKPVLLQEKEALDGCINFKVTSVLPGRRREVKGKERMERESFIVK